MSDGQIIVRDTDNQKQDINDLSRDTANVHSGGHNADAFYDAAKQYNLKIVSEKTTKMKYT